MTESTEPTQRPGLRAGRTLIAVLAGGVVGAAVAAGVVSALDRWTGWLPEGLGVLLWGLVALHVGAYLGGGAAVAWALRDESPACRGTTVAAVVVGAPGLVAAVAALAGYLPHPVFIPAVLVVTALGGRWACVARRRPVERAPSGSAD